MALIIGSLFNGQKPTAEDARNFFGVSFLSMMFLSMGAMPEMGITFASKPCAPCPTFFARPCSIYCSCVIDERAHMIKTHVAQ